MAIDAGGDAVWGGECAGASDGDGDGDDDMAGGEGDGKQQRKLQGDPNEKDRAGARAPLEGESTMD